MKKLTKKEAKEGNEIEMSITRDISIFKNGKKLHNFLSEVFDDLFEDAELYDDPNEYKVCIFDDLIEKSLYQGYINLDNENGVSAYKYELNIRYEIYWDDADDEDGDILYVYGTNEEKVSVEDAKNLVVNHCPGDWEFIKIEHRPESVIFHRA